LSHCIHDHFTRVGTRDKSVYNQAADYRINADACTQIWGSIEKAINQEPIFKLLCLKEKYKPKNLTSEIIYDDLIKDKQENNDNLNSGQDGQPLDDHIYSDGYGSGKPSDFDKFVKEVLGLPDKPNNGGSQNTNNVQSSVQMNNNRIKEAFVQTAKDIGHGSGGIIEQIKEMSKPVISWKRILRKSLNGLNKSEYDPKKLHRRVHGLSLFMKQNNMLDPKLSMYRAGKKPEEVVKVYVFADNSGSIGNKERQVIVSECYGICKQYKQFELILVSWDTKVYEDNIKVYNKQNEKELKDHVFKGGGGTSTDCIADYLNKQKLNKKEKFIIMTDMYFSRPEKLRPYSKDVIWISTEKNMSHASGS
jgi:predicted metal-dependent peptidase